MFKITEFVKASTIWKTVEDHVDVGNVVGLVRGYNIELTDKDGNTFWHSCNYIHGEPESYFNDDFHNWYWNEHSWKPTGRICFRGYGRECWSYEVGEYIQPVPDTDVKEVA